ncbi:MAG: hypothetical protein KatS3mg109_1444 [Pirellulaceae bacterium]|nr:MAG: hypothetical protein KatS3mg109_1444 [Pirellulaceae bacterium]
MERARIEADLRGALACEVLADPVSLQLYASDASIFQVMPLAVVRPRSSQDVIACMQYASEHGLPIHARGAGSGIAGESLGAGIVLDFSCHMRRILAVDAEQVTVQPGVVLAHLNRVLASRGRLFGPDPSTRSVTTMGSVLAIDASGSHWPVYGSPRRYVKRMRVVLADGREIEVYRNVPLEGDTDTRRQELVQRLADLLRREASTIQAHRPRSLVNRAGYHLQDILSENSLDLASLIVGSEGTLALIVEATLGTCPIPKYRGLAVLFFERLEQAAHAALEISLLGAATCDLMDRRLMALAREYDSRFDAVLPREAEALLLVEFSGDEAAPLRQQLENMVARLRRRRRLVFEPRITLNPQERNFYWRLGRRVVPMLYRLRGSSRPLPFVEDIAIPPQELGGFLVTLQNVLKRHEVTASLFAHAMHGQIHIRPFLDLARPDDQRKMQELAEDLYEQVLAIGGTISGEHGLGLSRTWFVRRQFGPLYDVFREVKRIFDPQNILNPGKVVADVPQPLTKNLRPVSLPASERGKSAGLPRLQLAWKEEEALYAARTCNGCGRCRTLAPDERMCPLFRLGPREEASPRAKANLLRGLLTGQLDPKLLSSQQLKAVADLCFHCHQCRVECPASVDVPRIVTELKAQHVAANGLRPSDWMLVHLDQVVSWGARFPVVANWALGQRQLRWLLEKVTGIAATRRLPRITSRSFLRRAQRRRLNRVRRIGENKVLYFVDLYANWFDPELAEALVAVLEHNGVSVYVPNRQQWAGMPLLAVGAVERATRLARRNVALLADAVRQGYRIVTTEPSALMCLRHEYPQLLADDEARLVADHTMDACEYLWQLHEQDRLALDFTPLRLVVGYHQPCHLRALAPLPAGEKLLRLIPGLSVQNLDAGCSGMAGTWGLMRRNFRASLRIGWNLIVGLRAAQYHAGASECSTCRLQMEQGAGKPSLHPIKLLALAYGLLPDTPDRWVLRAENELVT